MHRITSWCGLTAGLLVSLVGSAAAIAAGPAPSPVPPDQAAYQPRHKDPALQEMEKGNDARDKAAAEATDKVREAQKAKEDAAKKDEKVLRFDMSKVVKPASPDAFKPAFHFQPQAQFLTGTCWSFSTTSFYESEVYRLTGQKIKLSEIYTVYWEYVEKMRRFVRERGDSLIAEGSESNAFQHLWPVYGIVPAEAYKGVIGGRWPSRPLAPGRTASEPGVLGEGARRVGRGAGAGHDPGDPRPRAGATARPASPGTAPPPRRRSSSPGC